MSDINKKYVTGKIDGREVRVPDGTTILNAAKTVGIEIPHFCYHPGIGIEGSCRMCLVEIKGNPKLQVSCAMPFTEGIEVITNSASVKKAREGVLEFLLINHPLDCPICDKGGECPLQDYTYKYSAGRSRFDEGKRHLAKHKILSDHIIFDSERCILCTRCARFYKDITGTYELVVQKRGHKAEIASFDDKLLADIFSGNLADICPVGALTTRDFRFQARPWEMKTYESACGICGLNCSVQIWKKTRDKKILRMTPGHNPRVNDWWLCDRGRFGFRELLSGGRLKMPLIREEDEYRELSSQEAVAELSGILGDMLKRNGKESVKIVASPNISNEEAWLLREISLFTEKRGSVIINIPRSHFDFHKHLAKKDLLVKEFGDLEKSETVVFLGTDVVETHPVLHLRFRKMVVEKGTKIFAAGEFKIPDGKLVYKHIDSSSGDGRTTIKELRKILKSEGILEGPDSGKKLTLCLDERWLLPEIYDAVTELIDDLAGNAGLRNVLVLGRGDFNSRGILDIASPYFGFKEEIGSLFAEGGPRELILLGDDVVKEILDNPKFSAERFSFICALKKYDDDYCRKAHLVFLQRSFLEKDGTVTGVLGTTMRLSRSTKISAEAIPEWKILGEIGRALGLSHSHASEAAIFEAYAGFTGLKPAEYAKIRNADAVYTHYDRELRK